MKNIQFVGRQKEKQTIHEALGSGLIVVYGRRRVGKTTLVLEATKDKETVYYLARQKQNLKKFYSTVTESYPSLSQYKKDWETLFKQLCNLTDVIIIDEFQNMLKEDDAILTTLQHIIDTIIPQTNTTVILTGSAPSIIKSEVLSQKSPLYGRRNASIELKPFQFDVLHQFFPDASIEELIHIYSVTDGIPYYLERATLPFWPWLEKEIDTGILRDEMDFLLRYQFTNASTYKLLLEAIAKGKNTMKTISDETDIQRTTVSPYLRTLQNVDLIKKELPVTASRKSHRSRYTLHDNFVQFWFAYIYPNLSSIEAGTFSTEVIKPSYNRYIGRIFGQVGLTYIRHQDHVWNRIGRWWWKEQEIDIVAYNEATNTILFCECKWKDDVNGQKILTELRQKAKNVQWRNKNRTEKYVVIAKSFSTKTTHCVSLQDIQQIL